MDRANGTARKALVEGDDQSLSLTGSQGPDEFRVTAPRGSDDEAEPAKSTQDFAGAKPP